jgi:hypothetical protein
MNGLGKLIAAVGAVLLTVTAVALPDMGEVKAPVGVQVTNQSQLTGDAAVSLGVQPSEIAP